MRIIILFYNNCTLKIPSHIHLLALVALFLFLLLFLLTINKNKIIYVHRCINRAHTEESSSSRIANTIPTQKYKLVKEELTASA